MSRQRSDLERGISSASADGEPLGADGSVHNPLAGARPTRRRRSWLRRLFLLAMYAAIVTVIVSQGSRFWQNHPVIAGLLPDFMGQNQPSEQRPSPPPVSRPAEQEPAVRIEPVPALDAATEPPSPTSPERPQRSVDPSTPSEPETVPDTSAPVASDAHPDDTRAPARDLAINASEGAANYADSNVTNSPDSDPESEPMMPAETTSGPSNPPPSQSARSADQSPTDLASTSGPLENTREANTSLPGDKQGTAPETRQVLFSESGRNQRMEEARRWFREGQQDRALDHLAEWLREDDHTEVRQLYGRLLLRADRPQAARRVLQPQSNTAEMELRAYADYRAGAYADAVRYYTQLLNDAPTIQTEWYLWLGIGSEQLENTAEARRYYRLYLRDGQQQSTQLRTYAQDRLRQLDR